jgi:hypothetical protein
MKWRGIMEVSETLGNTNITVNISHGQITIVGKEESMNPKPKILKD